MVKNKFRAMGLKMSYEPEGEVIGEEESDRAQDERLMRGGVGAGRGSSRPINAPTGPKKKPDPDAHKKAMDIVRKSIIAKHGPGSLM